MENSPKRVLPSIVVLVSRPDSAWERGVHHFQRAGHDRSPGVGHCCGAGGWSWDAHASIWPLSAMLYEAMGKISYGNALLGEQQPSRSLDWMMPQELS